MEKYGQFLGSELGQVTENFDMLKDMENIQNKLESVDKIDVYEAHLQLSQCYKYQFDQVI
jgi:hypothetical protein